eukprot:gnl/Spiro4/15126_TR8146_c0_g1_i1.p3 gnl/Spiro4/15126_TR8146_c0_g1~~gnl/Spiro4/15126_TR8146_c0_g1_i1.p3  ORF type:complete len:222 (-),score=39.26 gnl/Spiro4/15126_TR8146_c0_g1_i1:1598-2263(-)
MTLPNTNVTIDTPKKKAIAVGVLLLVWLTGFAVGKFNSKPNVSIEEHTQATSQTNTQDQDNTQSQDVSQDQTQSNTNQDLVKDTDVTTTTSTDKKPDGEVVTTTTTEAKTHVDNTVQQQQVVKDNTVVKVDNQNTLNQTTTASQKTDFKETITQSQPKWMVGVFGGLDTAGLGLSGNSLVTGPLMYGAEAGYRFLGPFWVDGKVMKTGAGLAVAAGLQMQF